MFSVHCVITRLAHPPAVVPYGRVVQGEAKEGLWLVMIFPTREISTACETVERENVISRFGLAFQALIAYIGNLKKRVIISLSFGLQC